MSPWATIRKLRTTGVLAVLAWFGHGLFGGAALPTLQAQGPSWSEPEILFDLAETGSVSSIASVASRSGEIHLFWASSVAGQSTGSAIYYSKRDASGRWTPPTDILLSRGGGMAEEPRVTLDGSGMLHLVWHGGNPAAVQYSRAQASQAHRASAWAPPEVLARLPGGVLGSGTTGNQADIMADDEGLLHIVYTEVGGPEVWYSRSTDSGLSWTEPLQIANGPRQELPLEVDAAVPGVPDIAVDDAGGVHVVWTYYRDPGGWPTLGVFYTRSDRVGEDWTDAIQLDDANVDFAHVEAANNTVHVVWSGTAERAGRWHRYSLDGGSTWLDKVRVTQPGFLSMTDSDLELDAQGRLHLVTAVTGYPDRPTVDHLAYFQWREGDWVVDQSIGTLFTDFPAASLRLESELHTFAKDLSNSRDAAPMMHAYASVGGEEETAFPTLTPRAVIEDDRPAVTVAPTATPEADASDPTRAEMLAGLENPAGARSALPLSLAVGAALIVILVTISVVISRPPGQRRRS